MLIKLTIQSVNKYLDFYGNFLTIFYECLYHLNKRKTFFLNLTEVLDCQLKRAYGKKTVINCPQIKTITSFCLQFSNWIKGSIFKIDNIRQDNIIFTSSMSSSKYGKLPKYKTVRDFDYYEAQQPEVHFYKAFFPRKQDFVGQTKESQHEETVSYSPIQNFKMKRQTIQTSFHKNFMSAHILSVEKNLLRFLEKSYPQFQTFSQQTLLRHIFTEDINPSQSIEKLNDLLRKDNKYFEEKQKNIFLTELFYDESLYEFLSLACNSTCSEIALELAFIASLFCKLYKQKQQTELEQDQIAKMVDEALESGRFTEELKKLEYLSLHKVKNTPQIDRPKLEQNLRHLIRVLGNTIILIIEEYFTNPFSKQIQTTNSLRRSFNFMDISNDEFSDDENEIHFDVGNKKQKI